MSRSTFVRHGRKVIPDPPVRAGVLEVVGLPDPAALDDNASEPCSESSFSDDERDLFADLLGLDSSDSEEEGVGCRSS